MISSILRRLPSFKGKRRLARLLLGDKIGTLRDCSIRGKYGCIIKVPNILEPIGFEIYINCVYEKETIGFISNRLLPGKILLDIGANIGAICIPVCKLNKGTKVIGVEAAPWVFQYLEFNAKENNISNITLINRAVTSESNESVIFYGPRDKFGKGSMAPVFTSDGVNIESITLDDLTGHLDSGDIGLIKMDIEGFEYRAFLGGTRLLTGESAPDILFEFVDWAENAALAGSAGAAQALLIEFGYKIYRFRDGKLGSMVKSPLTVGACLLFATKKSPSGISTDR